MRALISLLLAVVFCGVALAAGGDASAMRFEIYPLSVAENQAIADMVRELVGDEGSVTVDRAHDRLLVATTDEKHAVIADIVRKTDVPPVNVRIDVEFRGAADGRKREASIRVDGHSGSTMKVNPQLEDTTYKATSTTKQMLLVASGRCGSLKVGEEVPYLEWLMDYGLQRGLITQQVVWRQVGASMVVEPTVLGDGSTIRVRLTPELSGLVDGNPYRIQFAGMASEVLARDGETFQIGGIDQYQDFYSHFLVGMSAAGSSETLNIYMTPHLVKTTK